MAFNQNSNERTSPHYENDSDCAETKTHAKTIKSHDFWYIIKVK